MSEPVGVYPLRPDRALLLQLQDLLLAEWASSSRRAARIELRPQNVEKLWTELKLLSCSTPRHRPHKQRPGGALYMADQIGQGWTHLVRSRGVERTEVRIEWRAGRAA